MKPLSVLTLSKTVHKQVRKYGVEKKFAKQLALLTTSPKHPSLRIELLEPKAHGIYSFRIDRKYRTLFIFRDDKRAIEIIAVTVHYQ